MKLLLAEDEKELSNALVRILRHSNYTVDAVYDGAEALDFLGADDYDCVILDVMMPKLDGFSVVKKLRENGNHVPVLMLTAKSELDDKIAGLDAGADDYLTKPFAMQELLARLRALTRRKGTEVSSYTIGNTSLNQQNYELFTSEGESRLTNKEFQMMEMLMSNPNTLISTEKFMESVWGYESEAEINVVWVYISALRKKLTNIGANISIKAVRGVGYRLEVDQTE